MPAELKPLRVLSECLVRSFTPQEARRAQTEQLVSGYWLKRHDDFACNTAASGYGLAQLFGIPARYARNNELNHDPS